ncbi:class I SAM-dependent methyltransferase, partial [Patescibacteria group bacterium]|nr:class I SAM-dependent methyltransferase [Patescibacteria group bacterium]
MKPEIIENLKRNLKTAIKKIIFSDDKFISIEAGDFSKKIVKMYSDSVTDAMEYLKIDAQEFWRRQEAWPKMEETLWKISKSPENFYRSWNNEAAEFNICANVSDQLVQKARYNTIAHFFRKPGNYVDYGCGTATLTLNLVITEKLDGKITLLDVPNETSDFVRFKIKKHSLAEKVSIDSVFNEQKTNFADGVICIDVLEHIENSSDIFINKISPMIKKGGYLFMRAPWGGQLTHLDAATDNFYS